MNMWHKIDFDKLILLLLPTFLRKPRLFSYLKALLSPLKSVYDDWSADRLFRIDNFRYNSQKCYLRGVLNKRYDFFRRRITIRSTLGLEGDFIYTPVIENLPVYLGTMFLEEHFNYAGSGVDFLVYVPEDVLLTSRNEIIATIEYYVLAGKSYEIVQV